MNPTTKGMELKYSKVGKNKIPIAISVYLMMFAYALSTTIIGPLVMSFIKQYGISLSDNGLITFFQGFGGILSVSLGVFLSDKLKKTTWIIITFGLYSISIILMYFVSAYFQLLFLFFLVGASTRMLDATLNAYVSYVYQERRAFYLSILHASYGIGALVGPLLSIYFANLKTQTMTMFLFIGVFCLMIFAIFIGLQRKSEVEERINANSGFKSIIKLIKNRNMILMFFLAFIYVGFVISISTWIPTYMVKELKASIFFSGKIVSALWIGIISGRIAHSFLSLRYKKRSLMILGNLIGGSAIIIATIINSPLAYMFGYFISGFFISAIMPLCMAIAGEKFPQNNGSASSLLILGGTAGIMIVPMLVGLVADKLGFYIAVVLLSLFPFASSFLAALLSEKHYE